MLVLHQKNTKIPAVSLHGSTVSPCSHDGGRFPRPAIPSTTWAVWRSAQAGNARVGGTGNPVGVAVTIGDWQTDKLEILGTRRWNMLKIMACDYVWCIIYHAEGFCSSTEQLSGWKRLHVVRNLTGCIFVIWDLDLWAMHHPWSSWAVIATSAAPRSFSWGTNCALMDPDGQVSRPLLAKISVPKKGADARWCEVRVPKRVQERAKVCIVLICANDESGWIFERDIIEISWVQTYFQKSKWTILVHVPRVLVQDAWTGEIWPTPSCLSPWPTKVSGAWQEPAGTIRNPMPMPENCTLRKETTVYVYLLYALYTPNCLKQFPNATKNNPHDRTWRNHDKSYSLWSVSLQTCLGKDSSLESQQLSILHTLMATVRKFLLTNWLDAMTQGTFWLVRELRELRELFNMVRC